MSRGGTLGASWVRYAFSSPNGLSFAANTTPIDLANHFLQFMDGNDRIFVIEVPDSYAYRTLLNDPAA